jgi:hypothetical protein
VGKGQFAGGLYDKGKQMLQDIKSGTLTLVDVEYDRVVFSRDDFWPNSTLVKEDTLEPDRKFTMDMLG